MKYLAIITLALALVACENKGKKKETEETTTQISEAEDQEVKNVMFKGTVMNLKDSSTISMAMIIVPGTTIGSMTGPDGKYMINAPENTKKLLFVMDGFEKATVEVKAKEEGKVFLTPKSN